MFLEKISRYENEALTRIEDLDNTIMKLQLRLAEAEDTIEGLNGKCISLEKTKQRLLGQIDDLEHQVDQANQLAIQLERKARNFDKIIEEWKAKVDELTNQLEAAKKENRYVYSVLKSNALSFCHCKKIPNYLSPLFI